MEPAAASVQVMSETDLVLSIALTLVLMCFSAFFSGSETALTAASRARMHQLEKDGEKRARNVNWLFMNREKMVGALLLGNTFVNIAASALVTSVLLNLFGDSGVAIATIATTALVLIFCEVLPKTFAIARPDMVALRIAGMVRTFALVFYPIVASVGWIVALLLRQVGVKSQGLVEDKEEAAHEELRGAIDLHHKEGAVESADRLRLVGALDLKDLTVEDVMIHRKNIQMLNADMDRRQLVMKALASPHTRLPLYRGEKEEIIGILHAKDLLRAALPLGGDLTRIDLDSVLRKPWFVPETTQVKDQLDQFLAKGQHFALVVDEYGELQGLITLEDILEEIVGAIHDEHDVHIQGVRAQPDGSVNVDGWVPIRDLNRATGWALPDDEAVTVAGLVIHEAQTIPEPGQSFVFHSYRFNILRRHRNQVTGLNVSRAESG